MALWLRTDRRDDLVAERTRTLSRLHVLLRDLHPGGAERTLTAQRAAALLGRLRPVARVDRERKRIAHQLLADGRRLDQRITAATKAIGEAVTSSGTTLTGVFGPGPVLAAKILGHAGDRTRFPDRDHVASYTGTAPIQASSGDVRRHRLNRGGNRQRNTALHIIAVCQIRDPSPGQVHYQHKLRQAKTPRRPAAPSSASSPMWSTGTWQLTIATTTCPESTYRGAVRSASNGIADAGEFPTHRSPGPPSARWPDLPC